MKRELYFRSETYRARDLQALLAELVGTAFFIFLSTATVTSGCHTTDVANQSGTSSQLLSGLLQVAVKAELLTLGLGSGNGGDTSLTNGN